MEAITRETTFLLEKTNTLAADIAEKSEKLNTVVDAVKNIGVSINNFNNSINKITDSISKEVDKNEEKIAQVVQWSNVVMDIAERWKQRKAQPDVVEAADQSGTSVKRRNKKRGKANAGG